MKRRLGIISGCVRGYSELESLKLIKEAGFDSVFSGTDGVKEVVALKNESEKLGLELEFLHSPFYVKKPRYVHINEFWRADLTYLPLMERVETSIDAAAEAGISTIVQHVSGDWIAPPLTDTGFSALIT